ncbi:MULTISPECIES: hypothetical protein [unclassified Campylobacter]|uniref:hypothetical protein n=1 Tax=unclassified Campylobacter TaxID=2593542 RepID=UPI0022E9CFB5|nr:MULTISPECIES: hypothetical protein [unclassified Campylobacter]MDA3054617.1 guided entry of tail-anchored proteins factor 1 [Campylobacter sp. VBCF_07 NA4]MDA3070135.1 guided entry of tail-anchored proteins factor 1 [Campylobacter sp. VBCF_08 NA3]WBR54569.1 hypothetical protein PF027_01500 [Campylobacter sp. VBCF_01 NA2]
MESIFDEEKKVESLGQKVEELIRRYSEAREENARLRAELVSIKAQNEAISMQLGTLEEDAEYRKLSDEELSKKLDEIFAKDDFDN